MGYKEHMPLMKKAQGHKGFRVAEFIFASDDNISIPIPTPPPPKMEYVPDEKNPWHALFNLKTTRMKRYDRIIIEQLHFLGKHRFWYLKFAILTHGNWDMKRPIGWTLDNWQKHWDEK